MKRTVLIALVCFFTTQFNAFGIGCTGGTFANATGTIGDGTVTTVSVGIINGSSTAVSPICTGTNDGMRTQYTVIASELANAGFVAGPISSLAFQLNAGSGTVPDLKIRISDTPFPDLISDFDEMIFTDVFGPQAVTAPSAPGLFTFTFATPYLWDGVSNILIDICHSAPSALGTTPVVSTGTTPLDRCNQGFGSQSCALFTSSAGPTITRPVMTFTQKVYSNNTNCSFLISPGAAFTSITLNFTEFLTESVNDVVTVYDGGTTASPVLGQYNGNLNSSLPSITSTGNQMLVKFISNASIVDNGWSANYVSNSVCSPSISISGNTSFCSGSQTTFSSIVQNEGTTPSIEWFVNNVSQGAGSTFSTSALVNSDVVHAVLTSNAACASPTSVSSNNLTISILPSPNVGILSNPPGGNVCAGSSITLSGIGAQSYSWNGIIDGVAFQPSQTSVYTVTGTDANNCSATASINVVVNQPPSPVITTTDGVFSVCPGTALTLDAGNGYSNYNWSSGGTAQTETVSSPGQFTVTVTDLNGCTGSASQSVSLSQALPSTPGSISGQTSALCNTSGNVYLISPVQNATSYLWTVTNGTIVNGQGTTSVTVDFTTFSSATVSVRALNGCGQSCERSKNISGKPKTPQAITGNRKGICDQTQTYSISPVTNATSYFWSNPPHTTIVNGQGTTSITLSIDNQFIKGNLSVMAVNACGNSNWLRTELKGEPDKPSTINGPGNVCRYQSGVVYTTSLVPGATSYYWKVPRGAIIQSGQNTPSIAVKFGHYKGEIEVRAVNDCGVSSERKKNIKFTCRISESELTESEELSVYPNPVQDMLNVSIPAEHDQMCTLEISDISGRIIFSTKERLASGENIFKYDFKLFSKGVYLVRILRENNDREIRKVVVE